MGVEGGFAGLGAVWGSPWHLKFGGSFSDQRLELLYRISSSGHKCIIHCPPLFFGDERCSWGHGRVKITIIMTLTPPDLY